MGLGGGFFMMIWSATTKTAHFLDARETASRHAHAEMFKGNATLSERGEYRNCFSNCVSDFL